MYFWLNKSTLYMPQFAAKKQLSGVFFRGDIHLLLPVCICGSLKTRAKRLGIFHKTADRISEPYFTKEL